MRTKITIHRKHLIMSELQLLSSKPLVQPNVLVPKLYSWWYENYWSFQFSKKKRLPNVFISNRKSAEISNCNVHRRYHLEKLWVCWLRTFKCVLEEKRPKGADWYF